MNQSNATSSSSSSNSSNNVSTRHTANASFPFSFVLPDDTEESSTSSSNTIGRILTRSLTKLHQQQLDSKTHKLPPVTYQKIMTKEKPCNIINILESSRLTGRMPRLISDYPDKTLLLISQRLNILDYPFLIKRLDQLSVTINFKNDSREVNELLKILRKLEYRLIHFDRDSSGQITNPPREEFEVEKINLESATLFRQYGGIEIFKRILLMSLLVSETANKTASNNNPNNIKTDTKLEPITWPFKQQPFDFKFSLDTNKNNNNNNNDDDDDDDPSQQQNSVSKRNNTTVYHHSLENSKKTKLTSNSTNSNSNTNNNSNSQTSNESNHLNTILITESYSILKIKCKCIHILNRLICLPQFGKLVVNDLLHSIRSQPQHPKPSNESSNASQSTITSASSSSSISNPNNSNTPPHLVNNSVAHYDTILIQYLFSLLMFKDSRYLACQLIESILLHTPMLNLNRITNIKYILESIDDEGLASICRIFAVTLSDLDMSEKKYWANAQKKQQQLQLIQKQQQQLQQKQNSSEASSSSSSSLPTTSASSSATPAKKTIQLPLSIRDQNQELLLNIPTLLYRLVNLVRCKDYAVRYNGKSTELEHWIRYIDEALSDTDEPDLDNQSNDMDQDSLLMDLDMDFQISAAEPVQPASSSLSNEQSTENQLFQPALLAATKLNNFVHVLYTLSLLLIGKERKRVQKSLAKLRLASALNSLFDYLIWNCRCEYHNSSNGDGTQQPPPPPRSHICPEVAVKIQFLRLVHSFCDHSEYKRVVLSKDEIDEILKYNNEIHACLKVDEDVLKVEARLRCTKEKIGLLSKIVHVIKQEPFSASFRFWLTRAIESFLRGGTSYADQMFLISRGIVEDTLQNILAINFNRPKEVLQSCFDMLGELIKFNTNGFDILNNQLNDLDKFNMLLRMINQSLVDSNMFLRSIFLSIEFFENNQSVLDLKISSNKLLSYFDLFDRRIALLCRMINTINIQNLSQENVSCLNTTLVLLMLANRRNQLPKYLRSIKSKSIEMLLTGDLNTFANPLATNAGTSQFLSNNRAGSSATAAAGPGPAVPLDLITNFRDLLIFWQSHYLQKDKDCIGLEQNSRIDFCYWKHTVELLLDDNSKNNCSLSYYLKNDLNCLGANSKANRLDEYRCD